MSICKAIFLVVFNLIFLQLNGQSKKENKLIKDAEKFRNEYQFDKAEETYKKVLELNPDNFLANFELGLYFREVWNNYEKALPYFQKAESLSTKPVVFELFFYLGTSYHYFSDFEKALIYYEKFKSALENSKDASLLKQSVDYRMRQCQFGLQGTDAVFFGDLKNMGEGVNSKFSEYCSVFLLNGNMVFTKRDENNLGKYYYDYQRFEDVYTSILTNNKWIKATPISEDPDFNKITNTKYHESIIERSSKGDTLILFRENMLWYSVMENGRWAKPEIFSKNINPGKYQRHACLSADGKTMYFSSSVKNGIGGIDLYKSTLGSDGNWSEAINLGPNVNTTYDDDSPFLSKDGKRLYFSSKGHLGYGGYDIFYIDLGNNDSSKVKNVGAPINSPADDIFFKIDFEHEDKIYFSSTRAGGFGNLDLYQFETNIPPSALECIYYVNKKYTVSINAEESIDSLGVPLNYIWHMGDGSTMYGKNVKYNYARPGEYNIRLDVVDSLTGRKIENEQLLNVVGEFPIEIKAKTHIEAVGPKAVLINKKFELDASISRIENSKIINYYWKLPKGIILDGPKLTYVFDSIGLYNIDFEIFAKDSLNKVHRYCSTKRIEVVTELKLDSLILHDIDSLVVKFDSVQKETVIINGPGLDTSKFETLPSSGKIKLENIYFDFDKYNIRYDAKITMDKNIQILKQHPDILVKVVGHTDSKGSNEYNMVLSQNRAKSAVEYFKANGIPQERIVAVVYKGEESPIAPNTKADGSDYPIGRQKNRRDEFIPLRNKSEINLTQNRTKKKNEYIN